MSRVRLTPEGPFSLAASIQFLEGFTPADYQSNPEQTLDLAFPVDDDWQTAAVRVRQRDDGVVEASVGGDGNLDAVNAQLARILGLDVDGRGFSAVGGRDPVVAGLQARRPGFRPVAFCSPYEAAAWAIISQRVHMEQAARVKVDIVLQLGHAVTVAGQQLYAFPSPARLRRLESFPGLAQRKVNWLQALAEAALDGQLRAGDLRSAPTDDALASLQRLPGIGPFGAELVLARGAAHPDVLAVNERRLRLVVQHAYNLRTLPGDEQLAVVADAWRPYRTWVTALLRAEADPTSQTN
jgi:DNA-3-methyladenine glycosylase II